MANVATIVDVDVDVCMYLEVGGWGRYTYIHYIVPNDWEKVENWRTDYCVSLITSARSRIAVRTPLGYIR